MVKVDKIRGRIAELNTTQEAIADEIGMDRTTFYRRMSSQGLKFTIGEIKRLVIALDLSHDEAIDIFLSEMSQ